MDMPGRDPLDLMNEVENVLQIHSYAMNWPIGSGKRFQGVVDRVNKSAIFFTKTSLGGAQKAEITDFLSIAKRLKRLIPARHLPQLLARTRTIGFGWQSFSPERFSARQSDPRIFCLGPYQFRGRALF